MADIWDDDIDVDNESDLVKQLRAVIKAGKAKNDEYETELKTLRPTVRRQSVSEILKDLNVNPKIAGLVPTDIGADKESIKAWVDEYGDVFGAKASTTTTTTTDDSNSAGSEESHTTVDYNTQNQWERIQSQGSQAGTATPDLESEQLTMLAAAATAAKGDPDLYFSYLRGEVPIPS